MSEPRTAELRDLVRQARLARGLTQEAFAEAVGMSQRWVSNLETGQIALPRRTTLSRMAEVLGVGLADLYIAAGMAQTRAEARRLIAQTPRPQDPLRDVVFRDYEGLTPEGRRFVAEQVKLAKRLFGTEERRGDDAAADGPNVETPD